MLVNLGEDGIVRPVLLDYGWTVSLGDGDRLALCELVKATAEGDASALGSAMRKLGLVSSSSERAPERDLAFWAYYLRDTGSRETQRAEMDAFLQERRKERAEDKSNGNEPRRIVSVPDHFMFLLRTIALLRGLASALDTKVPYLALLSMYARRSVLVAGAAQAAPAVCPSPGAVASAGVAPRQ